MTNQHPDPPHTSSADAAEIDTKTNLLTRSEWKARRVVLSTLTVIGVATAFLLLYRLYMVVFLLFAAIALQVALSPLVEWLRRRQVPRKVSVLSLYTTLLILLGIALWYAAPPAITQTDSFIREAPQYYETGRDLLTDAPVSVVRRLARLLPEEVSLSMVLALTESDDPDEESPTTLGFLWFGLRTIFAILAIFVLAYYWTLEGNTILRKFVMKAPASQRDELRALLVEFQTKIGAYFRGTAILCAIVGVASTAAFLLIGIPKAIMLGLIMAIFEAVPVIGPVLGAIPAILVTLAVAPEKTLWVIGALLLIQGIEGNVLVPRVMDESVGVNPIVSLLAITAFGALFGIGGAVLAIPLAAIVQILLARLLFNTPIRQDMSTPSPIPETVSRSRVGILRLETQEIIQDLHKISPDTSSDNPGSETHTVDQFSDRLEGLALDLDTWLARVESKPSSSNIDISHADSRPAHDIEAKLPPDSEATDKPAAEDFEREKPERTS